MMRIPTILSGTLGLLIALCGPLALTGCGGAEPGQTAASTGDASASAGAAPASVSGDPLVEEPPVEDPDAERGGSDGDPDGSPAGDADPDADPDADDGATDAAEATPKESGIRLVRAPDAEDRGVLQTSIVRYTHPDGHRLDVVNVMHLADKEYYAELERRFEGYDRVLYEMIKPRRADPSQRDGDGGMLGMLQKAMGRALGATFQLDEIDYGRSNFVHADLTAEEFAELWEQREESLMKMMLRAMSAGNNGGLDGEITSETLFRIAKNRDTPRLRMLLAEMFSRADMLAGLTDVGPDGRDRSMLIGERNKAALAISMRELAGDADRVALFYGAGHWPDLDIRLREDHGFERGETEWLDAWTIEPKPAAGEGR